MKTILTAANEQEKLILDYIENNASEMLVEKINTGKKTMTDCFNYIVSEAKHKAVKGCAMIADSEVFGWAMHYFEEDSIKPVTAPVVKAEVKTAPVKETKKPEVKKQEKKADDLDECTKNQISMFDLFGVQI